MIRLDGAWEPRGYVGPRIEIRGRTLTKLWRGSPVLKTRFSAEQTPDGVLLRLEETALRYAGADEPYAAVKSCRCEGGAITVTEEFPITGESSDTYYPTQNSRYGNVTIDGGEVLAALRGTWRCAGTDRTIRFAGSTLRIGYGNELPERVRVAAVHDNHEPDPDCWRIVDADPAREGVGSLGFLRLQGGKIRARIPVCDAEPVDMIFEREKR